MIQKYNVCSTKEIIPASFSANKLLCFGTNGSQRCLWTETKANTLINGNVNWLLVQIRKVRQTNAVLYIYNAIKMKRRVCVIS